MKGKILSSVGMTATIGVFNPLLGLAMGGICALALIAEKNSNKNKSDVDLDLITWEQEFKREHERLLEEIKKESSIYEDIYNNDKRIA
jgi:uncharacterized protein (UPF0254 family)